MLWYFQWSTKVSGEKGVNSCKTPAQSAMDLVSYPVGWTPGTSASFFPPSPCLVSHTGCCLEELWGLCMWLQYQVHLRSIVPLIPHRLSGPHWRTLGSCSTMALRYVLPLLLHFSWTMGVLIPDKASRSHCNINWSVKIPQMGWAKSLTLFLCCKKPGGASATFSIASQESNSSLSLNCQSFVPGHRAK